MLTCSKFTTKNTDSPSCQCGFPFEDIKHFALNYPICHDAGTQMLPESSLIISNFIKINNNQQPDIYVDGNNTDIDEQQLNANILF